MAAMSHGAPDTDAARRARATVREATRFYDDAVREDRPTDVLEFYRRWAADDFEERRGPDGTVITRDEMLRLMERVAAAGTMLPPGARVLESGTDFACFGPVTPDGTGRPAVEVDMNTFNTCVMVDEHGWHGVKGRRCEVRQRDVWRQTWVQTAEGWRLRLQELVETRAEITDAPGEPD